MWHVCRNARNDNREIIVKKIRKRYMKKSYKIYYISKLISEPSSSSTSTTSTSDDGDAIELS